MKKRILFIGTGGTIASEMSDEGLLPGVGASSLLGCVPDIAGSCEVESRQLYDLDSTNIGPEQWLGMAEQIRLGYSYFDGFVISHGTDTMAYTAAALSYLVQGSSKPVILTGAQKPIGFETTDSRQNLRDAFAVACDPGMHGVCIVFNGRVILGTRARKTHSKSFDAFSSINYPNIADVRDGRIMRYIEPECLERPRFYTRLDTRVGLLKLIPGTSRELLDYMLGHCRALIIESFGVAARAGRYARAGQGRRPRRQGYRHDYTGAERRLRSRRLRHGQRPGAQPRHPRGLGYDHRGRGRKAHVAPAPGQGGHRYPETLLQPRLKGHTLLASVNI